MSDIRIEGIDLPIRGTYVLKIVDESVSGAKLTKELRFHSYKEAKQYFDTIHAEPNRIIDLRITIVLDSVSF